MGGVQQTWETLVERRPGKMPVSDGPVTFSAVGSAFTDSQKAPGVDALTFDNS